MIKVRKAVGLRGSGARRAPARPTGLCGAAARCKGRVAVKDFADAADSMTGKVAEQRIKEGACLIGVIIHAPMRDYEWSDESAPYRSLMISPVTIPATACVAAHVVGVVGARLRRPCGGERAGRERYGDGRVACAELIETAPDRGGRKRPR